jgi:hypothetical protein
MAGYLIGDGENPDRYCISCLEKTFSRQNLSLEEKKKTK